MADVKKSSGIVKWFSGQKGFGFIAPDDGGEDLFVHQTEIRAEGFRFLREGQLVQFLIDSGEDGRAKAVDVVPQPKSYSPGGGHGGNAGGRRGRGRRGFGFGRFGGREGRGGGRSGGEYAGVRGGVCYNCGRVGHLARDCYRDGGGDGGNRAYGGGGARVCYNCGEEGHFARDCPNNDQT